MRTRRRAAVSKTAGRWFEANRVCQSLVFRGLPPPTPRPGRFAFHPSIVSGSQPRVRPIMASGSGSLRLSRPPLVMPRRSATCLTPRDMQPENTRHAVNLNDRRTRQTTNGTTPMLITHCPQLIPAGKRYCAEHGRAHERERGTTTQRGVWRHTQAAPRPMASGHRQRGRAPLPPLPPARHPRPSVGPRT